MGELYRQFIARDDLDIHKWHDYFPIYERYFTKFRGKTTKMLEIGVQGGGSARLFADWLGPSARMTGLDIDPRCRSHAIPGLIDIEIGDQADRQFLRRVAESLGPWDIILDDGGHTDNQILTSFEELFPFVNDGGIYLIEDTHAHYFDKSFRDHPENKSVVSFVADHFASLHHWTGQMDMFQHWHVPPNQRTRTVEASYNARNISAVHCYDSVIVVEKEQRHEPFCEVRTNGVVRKTAFTYPRHAADSETDLMRAELRALKASASWRLTAPLRFLSGLLK